jgi:hypothetical protein
MQRARPRPRRGEAMLKSGNTTARAMRKRRRLQGAAPLARANAPMSGRRRATSARGAAHPQGAAKAAGPSATAGRSPLPWRTDFRQGRDPARGSRGADGPGPWSGRRSIWLGRSGRKRRDLERNANPNYIRKPIISGEFIICVGMKTLEQYLVSRGRYSFAKERCCLRSMRDPAGYPSGVDEPKEVKFMIVAELIKTLEALPPDAPVALRTTLPDQRVRWDDIECVELRKPDSLPPVVLIR